jgi:hypothetical protein
LTERVNAGIMGIKLIRGAAAVAVACAALALVTGCAQKGNPIEPAGDLNGYRVVGSLSIEGYAEDVEVTGDLCLVAASQGGVVLVDVSDPANPVQLSVAETRYPATGCSYIESDSLAFATIGAQGVYVYDVSDLSKPVWQSGGQGGFARDIVTREVTPGVSHEVLVADGYGILTQTCDYWEGLDQWFLQQRYSESTSGVSRGICLVGSHALIAKEQVGVAVYEATNISHAAYVGGVDTPGEARAVAASDNFAYVADWRAGLQVVDISDPANPVIVGSAETDGMADGVAYHDGKAFVAAHVGGPDEPGVGRPPRDAVRERGLRHGRLRLHRRPRPGPDHR